MSKQAILYARSASVDRGVLQSQLSDCRIYAEQHGYTVVGEFADNGVNGFSSMANRVQGNAMLEVLERGKAQIVIVTIADRLSRDFKQCQALVQQWQEAGIETHSLSGPLSFNEWYNILQWHKAEIEAYESHCMKMRRRRAQSLWRRRGNKPG